MRCTPSTNITHPAGSSARDIGAQSVAATSTETSTSASDSPRTSPPTGAPNSGAQVSTANLIGDASTRSTAADPPTLRTSNRTGSRSASSRTWVTTPTIRPRAPSSSMAVATTSSVSGSSVPNPSSRKSDSSRADPDDPRPATWSARARASAREARNVSPPDSVRADRTWEALVWSTTPKPPDRPSTVRA